MNKLIVTLIVIVILAVIFFILGPFFILHEGEQSVVTRFGKIVTSHTDAGLKFKLPVVDTVVKYPKKILSWDGEPQRVPTSENQFIWIDTTARWKIIDSARYYEAVNTLQQGMARLDETIDSSIRTVIAANPLFEAVRNSNVINEIDRSPEFLPDIIDDQVKTLSATDVQSRIIFPSINRGRNNLSIQMQKAAEQKMAQFGIELIDIVVRQIRYSDDLTTSVYDRMIMERRQKAQEFRSLGEGAKEEWAGKVDNERRTILSDAYRRAEEIKGSADEEAAKIYAESYNLDRNFAIFWRSMESYRNTLNYFSKTLTTDLDYFDYLYSPD